MILKNLNKTTGFSPKDGRLLFFIFVGLVGFTLLVTSVSGFFRGTSQNEIKVDLEEVTTTKGKKIFVNDDGITFDHGETQSNEEAHSGSYSSKLDKKHIFGVAYEIDNLKPGERYHTSIWRLPSVDFNSSLVVTLTGNTEFYQTTEAPVQVEPSGWERLELTVLIPYDFKEGVLKIYPYGKGEGAEYYDDLTITKTQVSDSIDVYGKLPELELKIAESSLQKMEDIRKKAMIHGIMMQGEDDWVKGTVTADGKEMPAKIRLKGDMVGHLEGRKYSFRIKLNDPHAWKGMVTFSIQTPQARGNLFEWVYHQLLEANDVLATRYDFAHVHMNGQSLGVFAYEEHFEKQLVESRERREGPIVKFDETGLWDAKERAISYQLSWWDINVDSKNYQGAHIHPFKESKMVQSPVLSQQFDIAHTLMNQYHMGVKPTSEVFDVDRFAKYCALTDLTQAYHSIAWHNQRFYYNPVISKMEPIGYDGYTEGGPIKWPHRPFLGSHMDGKDRSVSSNRGMKHIFLDPVFARRYYHYLDSFSHPVFINEFEQKIATELDQKEKQIQLETPKYKYNRDFLTNRGRKIRGSLYPFNNTSIQAFTQTSFNDKKQLALINYHLVPLEVVGWGTASSIIKEKLTSPVYLNAAFSYPYRVFEANVPPEANFVFYQIPGLDSLYHSKIFSWQMPGKTVPVQETANIPAPESNEWFVVADSTIRFRRDNHEITSDIIIPHGYEVFIPAGTALNFVQKSKFLSYSPVNMNGTEDAPIRIVSTDSSANGFTLIQTKGLSEWKYVFFDRFNTLSDRGWNLTGGVTCYESPIDMSYCAIMHSQSEDALNLIRTNFTIKNLTINGAASDGFDADFCKGKILDSHFYNTVNDGMDFSGSQIEVKNCNVDKAGDKGLSVGENSRVVVGTLKVSNSKTGVAAKDLSNLNVYKLVLNNCETGITAYQKKPEYGSAKILLTNLLTENVKYPYLIEQGSILRIKGKDVSGI